MTPVVPEKRLKIPADELAHALADPLCAPRATPAPATTMLGSRAAYPETQAAFNPLLAFTNFGGFNNGMLSRPKGLASVHADFEKRIEKAQARLDALVHHQIPEGDHQGARGPQGPWGQAAQATLEGIKSSIAVNHGAPLCQHVALHCGA
ncbi:hypothetical protein AURDEDRAFT_173334 [Auricularia subglabra TFB-10046 SS5]|nr:hypothetical protein AURDEDRAFT_173334 [Auricularia subglabra TFB-10046 SS5]